ncbi:hypothetical protein G7Y89_g6999 [Cudoniella acicularis]|uniref:Uncharacterized protein n=1 Tax=Cudoniella acicularis TaxID=354080 RepID=A0A8H4RLM1_9HELO|nr:hypothetical protein G7Y89_g6999 [Cudoniella acicularis]
MSGIRGTLRPQQLVEVARIATRDVLKKAGYAWIRRYDPIQHAKQSTSAFSTDFFTIVTYPSNIKIDNQHIYIHISPRNRPKKCLQTNRPHPARPKDDLSITEDAELALGATGAVLAADQLVKTIDSTEHKTSHLVKAGIGAAVAVGAWELLRRAEADGSPYKYPLRGRSVSRSRSEFSSRSQSRSRTRSRSRSRGYERKKKEGKHHDRQLVEEIIGAYSVGKELLGDRKHHVAHLVGEAIGATGVIQELRARDKEEKK